MHLLFNSNHNIIGYKQLKDNKMKLTKILLAIALIIGLTGCSEFNQPSLHSGLGSFNKPSLHAINKRTSNNKTQFYNGF